VVEVSGEELDVVVLVEPQEVLVSNLFSF